MKWIDVRDELPMMFEKVLVCIKMEDSNTFVWRVIAFHFGDDMAEDLDAYKEPNSNSYWSLYDDDELEINYEITHWMRIELPESLN